MGISSKFFWSYLCFLLVSASANQEIITAEIGESVTLPCHTPKNNILIVEWTNPELAPEYVLLYRDEQIDPEQQHSSFENRVDLKDRQMKDGDVSLNLEIVTINDTGTYNCYVFSRGVYRKKRAISDLKLISSVYLHVVDPPGQTGGHTEDGGKEAGGKEAGGKEDGSFGLVIGLSVVAVVFSAAVVLSLIYRKHKQCNKDSHHPPAEPQTEMSESFLNSESPAAKYNDRNDLEANNCHGHSTRIPDVTLDT